MEKEKTDKEEAEAYTPTIPVREEVKGLKATANPNAFLDEEGHLYFIEFDCFKGTHHLVEMKSFKDE